MGGGGSRSTVQTTEPWEGQQPYLHDIFRQAQHLYGAGNPLVAEFSPMTQQGIGALTQQGTQGSPVMDPMQNFLTASMMNPAAMAGVGTDMPGQNPYLDRMVGTVGQRMGEQFQQQIAPSIAAQFGRAGRTGSGIHQQVVNNAATRAMEAFGQQAADIYGRDYSDAMGRDVQRRQLMGDIGGRGAALAPSFQQMQLQNIDQLLRAGAITEQQAQRLIDAPYDALSRYSGTIYGSPGGATSTTQTPQGSRLMGGLGGAAMGAGLAGSIPALGPFAIPMAVGGGLLGMWG